MRENKFTPTLSLPRQGGGKKGGGLYPEGRQSGFTLLEVMVALLIIATSFIVLLHSRNQSVIAADYARHMTIATLLASGKMGEIEQEGINDRGEETGDVGEDYPGFTWQTTVSDMAYEHIKEVRVVVLWGEGRSQRSVELINYVKEKE